MTAETLKPFITPTSANEGFPAKVTSAASAKRRTRQLIPYVLGVIGLGLVIAIMTLTIWQTSRITHLDKELKSLKRVVDHLQQRLGINYLDEFDEFQKEYENALIDFPKKVDGLTDDEDEDEDDVDGLDPTGDEEEDDDNYSSLDDGDTDYDDYTDMINKLQNLHTEQTTPTSETTAEGEGETDSASSASNDDNVFDDFTSYNAHKKKLERKSRSIADIGNEQQNIGGNHTELEEKPSNEAVLKESSAKLHHRRRMHSRRRHLVRKGESLISARSDDSRPAAHFHLSSRKRHLGNMGYHGDMYIGNDHVKNSYEGHFQAHDGVLTVLTPGLYYVYAQICYNNSHDQNGFIVFQGDTPFLQCLNTVPTNMPHKVHTCHTSGLIHLERNERIHLKDIHNDRNVVLREANNRSYFGIFKV
ncbi:protein eiger isoform X1 [Drosophila gunungcola]|uniref:THD domain-containing protein n=1 Tax=Drosophila gunungcola TaxID=103775 RepID=A0A9Q0BLV6_9MUSC|nr:protein eiger isoform X1 [Drosophila gunungcola]KAI8036380.1 hypothetical protein M5D96_010973 [Drosophila gunungcola]